MGVYLDIMRIQLVSLEWVKLLRAEVMSTDLRASNPVLMAVAEG